MLPNISKPVLESAKRITNSDHKIIVFEWQPLKQIKQYRTKKRKRVIYLYKETSEERWEEFRREIEQSLEQAENTIKEEIKDEERLNKC